MKKKILVMLIICVITGFSAFAAGQQEAKGEMVQVEPITLIYAHVGVEGAPQSRYAEEFSALVNEKTEGRVSMKIFPNSQLGNVSEMVDSVKSGSVNIAHHDFASLGQLVPELSVFSAPFVFRDAEHAVMASNPKTSPLLRDLNKKLIEAGKMRIIGSFYRGARQLTTTDFPVYTPADVAGKKIRGVPNKIWMTMLEGMGAIPTPVEFPELPTALMTGLVVGQENPLTNIYAAKLYEVQDYVMLTSHMQSVLCTFINEDTWQSISESDRAAIEDAAFEMSQRSLGWAEEADGKIIDELSAEGVTFIGEEEGLDLDAFRSQVLEKVNMEFPEWTDLINQISDIK
ncbi:MAG: TRAP transporter substrate-binding protein [Spirochaetales bacterium]|uniref:TRAP transporter substrate-binding protein n=1 Tax=Candidatus Thalassospirochaeta sargassi TaxID=3119039 RepID=A0AAJ1IB27_9SPIO|nr:TRAP transporter substrate-binding protein [Spirochaetales bacterium]